MSEPTVEQLRERLLQSFDDYHASIRKQTRLLDELIEAVRREERERCGKRPGAATAESPAQSAGSEGTGVLKRLGRAVRG